MENNCTHNCESCSADCESRSLIAPENDYSKVKHVIGIVSGKGGVGKTLVTTLLAVAINSLGFSTAILDADVTGPSIPRSFGIKERLLSDARGLVPAESKTGIKLVSANLLLEKEETPVLWRGPMISGLVKQFWTDVAWGDVDYMLVDMPPGTGDVSLTVFQSLPLDGIVIVTSPQELVSMVVKKSYNMAKEMDIPVLGLIENMSGFVCPDCGKHYDIFGTSRIEDTAKELDVPVLAKIPIDPQFASLVDKGAVELAEDKSVNEAAAALTRDNAKQN